MFYDREKKSFLYRFAQCSIPVLMLLPLVVWFLNQWIKESYCEFHRLNKDDIKQAIVYRYPSRGLGQQVDSCVLSDLQLKQFVYSWNNSYPIGLSKYLPRFILYLRMKNGSERTFRVNAGLVKEQKDYTFRLFCGANLFDSVKFKD